MDLSQFARGHLAQRDDADIVDAIVAKVLDQPIDQRLGAFAEAMQHALDALAARYPRSSPRDLARMAKRIGRRVLAKLREAR